MKINLYLYFACLLLLTGELSAQEGFFYEKTLPGYQNFVLDEFNIDCNIPDKFLDLNQYMIMWRVQKDYPRRSDFLYGPVFRSKDEECILMYPFSPSGPEFSNFINSYYSISKVEKENDNTYPRIYIARELKSALGSFDYYDNPEEGSAVFCFDNHVKIDSGKAPKEMFNADTIYFYDLPLREAYLEKYNYCTAMVIAKNNRATMLLKWFFTDEGKKKQKEYISLLNKAVWYNDGDKKPQEE